MKAISVIHHSTGPKANDLQRIDREHRIYRSSAWVISDEAAKGLIGGRVYLHEAQSEASYFGGEIIEVTPTVKGHLAGRRDIVFKHLPECSGVKCARGWGCEKAFWETTTA